MNAQIRSAALSADEHKCPQCSVVFQRRRKDQRFCAKSCAKAATRNQTRHSRTVASSVAARRIHEVRHGQARNLSHAFYETPPAYRAEFLERLIAEGRKKSDLRRQITQRDLLRSWIREGSTGRLHIAHVLDHYCSEVYGLRSCEVLEPSRVLPRHEDIIFPAECFGPDAPPIYGDGRLRERPCPWVEWKNERKKSLHHYKGDQQA